MYPEVSGKYTPLHGNLALYGVHTSAAWWECIPRYSLSIWNSGSVSYPHFPSGKPVWPHIAQFQNRDKDDQTGYFCNQIIFIPPDHDIWRLTWLSNQFPLKIQILKSYFVSTRKRSSFTISILEMGWWHCFRRKISEKRLPSQDLGFDIGSCTFVTRPNVNLVWLLWVKDSWAPSCFYPQITFPLLALPASSSLKNHLHVSIKMESVKTFGGDIWHKYGDMLYD